MTLSRRTITLLLLPFALVAGIAGPAGASANIVVVNMDDPGEGFNDSTPANPVAGNPGTTLGAQRLNAFQAAADVWGLEVDSDATIQIEATMDPLDCSATEGVLGQAGPQFVFRFDAGEVPGIPPNLWHPEALANARAGEDLDPTTADISATFNSDIDNNNACFNGVNFWYGITAPAPNNTIDFFKVVLHEIAHGLGFVTFVDMETGEKLNGFDDVFMLNLEDHSTGRTWDEMNNAQRLASATDTFDLHWIGQEVIAGSGVLNSGVGANSHVRMFAPNEIDEGSSVSHWDTSLSPNELMEPFENANSQNLVTTALLEDLGWNGGAGGGGGPSVCVADTDTLCLNDNRFQIEMNWRDHQNRTGTGKTTTIPNVTDSGLFYYVNPNNLEMLIKVIDACSTAFDTFWVFFAATTDVEFTVTVVDTQNGKSKQYFNALGHPADAVTDTMAFSTCSGLSSEPGIETELRSPSSGVTDEVRQATLWRQQIQVHSLFRELRDGALERLDLAPRVAPAAPSNLAAEALSETEIQIDWQDNSNNEDEFRVELRPPGSDFIDIGAVPTNATAAIISGLDPDTTYTVRVRARNGDGDSDYSNEATATTFAGGAGVPDAPSNLGAMPLSTTEIALGWQDNSDNEDEFRIEIRPPGSGFFDIGSVPANNTGATIVNLDQGTSYGFRVRARNAAGNSLYSNEATAATLGTTQPCIPDGDTHCLNENRFQIELNWRDHQNRTGTGKTTAIPNVTDSGLFFYNNPNNLEMLVKVIDACSSSFDAFWVFFAATTDVEFTLTVTDTQTGASKQYVNELGHPANAVTDTSAFATCP